MASSTNAAMAFVILLVVMGILFTMVSPTFATITKQEYMRERAALVASEAGRSFSAGQPPLNDAELRLDNYILKWRAEFIRNATQDYAFHPSRIMFYKMQETIRETQLFRMMQDLPKGAILHLHGGSGFSYRYVISKWTYNPSCYLNVNESRSDYGSLRFFSKSPSDASWQPVQKLRNASPSPAMFDEELYQSFTITEADDQFSENHIWKIFDTKLSRIGGGLAYVPVWEDFFWNMFTALAADNIQYVEIRHIPGGVYDDSGPIDPSSALQILQKLVKKFQATNPTFNARVILCGLRWMNESQVLQLLETTIQLKHQMPDFVAGFDLVDQEDAGHPLLYFLDDFLAVADRAAAVGLKYFFHAGETDLLSTSNNLIDAVLLNTSRIGHGFGLYRHPELMQIIRERQIAIEVCPISNQMLRYVTDLRLHPAIVFMDNGLPITLSPDDPAVFGYNSVSYDWWEAQVGWNLRVRDLKQLATNSIEHSAMPPAEKHAALVEWTRRWNAFVARWAPPPH